MDKKIDWLRLCKALIMFVFYLFITLLIIGLICITRGIIVIPVIVCSAIFVLYNEMDNIWPKKWFTFKNLETLTTICMEDTSIIVCKSCGLTKKRIRAGKYPSGRSTKWVDENGKEFNGRVCADCHKKKVADKKRFKEQEAKRVREALNGWVTIVKRS